MSTLSTNAIIPVTGTTVTLGESGDTISIPAGTTITNSGTANNFGGGKVLQVVNTQTGAVATGTTIMPADDTIPQITEGTEFMTLAITPASTSNKLLINVGFAWSYSNNGTYESIALFNTDAHSTNALSSLITLNLGATEWNFITFQHYMTAPSASATTFRVRSGSTSAGTVTFNGQSGGRAHAGILASSITIMEISA